MDFTHADIASIYAFITELGFRYAAQRYVMLNICFFFRYCQTMIYSSVA